MVVWQRMVTRVLARRAYASRARPVSITCSSGTTSKSSVERLRSGIRFEVQRGCQNYPGTTMLFSDFLVGELRQVVKDEVDPLLASAGEYGRWPSGSRRAFLAKVEARLDELDRDLDLDLDQHRGQDRGQRLDLGRVERGSGPGDQPVGSRPYYPFVIDTETTGVSSKTAHVVELCVLDLLTGAHYLRRVRLPEGVAMHPGAEAVTGISTEELRHPELPTFEVAMRGALDFIYERVGSEQSPLLVGHNILRYDVRLLRNRMLDSGLAAGVQRLDAEFAYFDTLSYAKEVASGIGAESNKLTDLYRACTGREPENAHSSLGDVLMTRDVLASLAFGENEERDWDVFFGSRVRDWVVRGEERAGSAERGGERVRQSSARKQTASAALSPSELLDVVAPVSSVDSGYGSAHEVFREVSDAAAEDDEEVDMASAVTLATPIKELGVALTPTENKLLAQMRLETLRDVLYVFPRGYLVASVGAFPAADADVDQSIVLPVYVDSLKVFRGKFHILNAQFRCLNYDDLLAGTHLQTMHQNPVIHHQVFRKGRSAAWAIMNEEKRIRGFGSIFGLSGQVKLTTDKEGNQKFVLKEASLELFDLNALSRLPRHAQYLQPLYPSRSKATSQSVAQIVSKVLEKVEKTRLANPIPADIRQAHGVSSYASSIIDIHRPASAASYKRSRSSLAFHELFLMQLRLLCRSKGRAADGEGDERRGTTARRKPLDLAAQADAVRSLAFPLTGDQQRALDAINDQLDSANPSSTLLQGDVGCGKTVVALLAAHVMASNGRQVAFMAPTEVLAEQHIKSLEAFCEALPADQACPSYALLTGSTKPAERRALLQRLAAGEIDILVGTHALISAPVQFCDLGLAIVDEQHKFGVEQRAALLTKASPAPHMLNMSATPIPRSLALVLYGEMELVEIRELPPGRTPVATSVWVEDDARDAAASSVPDATSDTDSASNAPSATRTTREKLAHAVKAEIDSGGKCFIVCPLIDKGEKEESSVRTAVTEKERLCATEDFKGAADTIGLLHGRMNSADKEQVLRDFADPDGTVKVLISTTVVEVGVNVPDASLMIIEHAERFGLAQLHQLRGRVGRGSRASSCILVTGPDGSADRLRILEETNDGFLVAEADLANRGSGNIIGTEQAGDGMDGNHLWELPRDAPLVTKARKAAAEFLERHGTDERGWNVALARAMADSHVELDMSSLPDLENLLS